MNWLIGNKVELRPVEPSDLDTLLLWENERTNWEMSGTIVPFSRDLMERYIQNSNLSIYQTGQLRLIIQARASGEAVGTLDLFDFDPFHKRVGVGVLVAMPEHRRSGLAGESLELLKSYCFEHLDINQLYCNILTDNKASLKLFEKVGFQLAGCKKQWVRRGKQFLDEYLLQLIRSDAEGND